jgi:hypothetical protein
MITHHFHGIEIPNGSRMVSKYALVDASRTISKTEEERFDALDLSTGDVTKAA